MLIVLGSVLAHSDSFEEMLLQSQQHVERSRAEPGCLAHAVHVDLEDPLRMVFVERWADWAALSAHFRVPASVAFAKSMASLGARAPEMTIYEAAPSQPPARGAR